jgi:hypothetical protein
MKTFTTVLLLLMSALGISIYCGAFVPAIGAEKPILEILLYSQRGIPAGYVDSTTRDDATNICNALIASQSKHYATPVSRSRCIIRVQE